MKNRTLKKKGGKNFIKNAVFTVRKGLSKAKNVVQNFASALATIGFILTIGPLLPIYGIAASVIFRNYEKELSLWVVLNTFGFSEIGSPGSRGYTFVGYSKNDIEFTNNVHKTSLYHSISETQKFPAGTKLYGKQYGGKMIYAFHTKTIILNLFKIKSKKEKPEEETVDKEQAERMKIIKELLKNNDFGQDTHYYTYTVNAIPDNTDNSKFEIISERYPEYWFTQNKVFFSFRLMVIYSGYFLIEPSREKFQELLDYIKSNDEIIQNNEKYFAYKTQQVFNKYTTEQERAFYGIREGESKLRTMMVRYKIFLIELAKKLKPLYDDIELPDFQTDYDQLKSIEEVGWSIWYRNDFNNLLDIIHNYEIVSTENSRAKI